jgi:hypothetical protein
MVGITCASAPGCPASEQAILLEVWEHGATVQTSFPIAAGSPVRLAVKRKELAAEVTRCEADQGFGYMLALDIPINNEWFRRGYRPAWQSSGRANSPSAPFVC